MLARLDLRGLRTVADIGLDRALVWLAVAAILTLSAWAGVWLEQALTAPVQDWQTF